MEGCWPCVVLLVVSCVLDATMTATADSSWCPGRCSCALLYRSDCRQQGIRTMTANFFPVNSKKLRDLWLDHNEIIFLEWNTFKSLTSLRRLSISYNFLQKLDGKLFTSLRNLLFLDLSNNMLKSPLDTQIFRTLIRLKELNLASNMLTTLDGQIFYPLQGLFVLKLSNNRFICDCNLRSAVEWVHDKMLVTGAFCETGEPWSEISIKSCSLLGKTPRKIMDNDALQSFDRNGEKSEKFPLGTILAIAFGVLLLLVFLGVAIFCWKQRRNPPSKEDTVINEYDDIGLSSDYYYETISKIRAQKPRYVSCMSSASVPELPKTPRPKLDVKLYDDICLEDVTNKSVSYVEPEVSSEFPAPLKSSTFWKNTYSNGEKGINNFEVKGPNPLITNKDSSMLTKSSSSEYVVMNANLRLGKKSPLSVVKNGIDEGSRKNSQYFWNRESFWNI